jgi:hypothetical protein
VLESDGTFLYSKNTVELEEGRSYNEDAILAFLDEWILDEWMLAEWMMAEWMVDEWRLGQEGRGL